jgi:hypothetical protein
MLSCLNATRQVLNRLRVFRRAGTCGPTVRLSKQTSIWFATLRTFPSTASFPGRADAIHLPTSAGRPPEQIVCERLL